MLTTLLPSPSLLSSPSYGRHLSAQQIGDIVSPPAHEIDAVALWLSYNSIPFSILPTGHIISARANPVQLQRLLRCKLFLFGHKLKPSRLIVRKIGSYFLPAHIAGIVTYVSTIADVPVTRKGVRVAQSSSSGSVDGQRSFSGVKLAASSSWSATGSYTQGVSVTGTPQCSGGSGIPPCPLPIVSITVTLYLGGPLQNFNMQAPTGPFQMYPSSGVSGCASPLTSTTTCTLATGFLMPFSTSALVSIITTYNDSSTFTATTTIAPTFAYSTPWYLSRMYSMPVSHPVQSAGASQAIFANGDAFLQSDINLYAANLGIFPGNVTYLPFPVTFPLLGEASLDTQIMLTMTRNAVTWFWNYLNDNNFGLTTAAMLADLGGTPTVLSMSYGANENQVGIAQANLNM